MVAGGNCADASLTITKLFCSVGIPVIEYNTYYFSWETFWNTIEK